MTLIEKVVAAHEEGAISAPINVIINGIHTNGGNNKGSILLAFVWHATPEGGKFWAHVHDELFAWEQRV